MKPVDQTTFGFPGGNCFSACVASLLELELDAVPYFMHDPDDEWSGRFRDWLDPRGMYVLCLKVGADWAPAGLHILSGLSPRGGGDPAKHLHSVIARGCEIVHDPHPTRAGLLDRRDAIVLVPMDPARSAA